MKYIKLVLLASIMAIFMLGLVTSAPPFVTTSSTGGLQIESPTYSYLSKDLDHRFHAHVINSTGMKTNKTTMCFLHFYDTMGYDTNIGSTVMEFESYNGIDFALTIGKSNYSTKGYYAYVIQCNSTNEIGFLQSPITVTNSGKAEAGDIFTGVIWLLFIFSTLLLFYTFFMTLFKLVTADETVYDVLLAWSSYILVIIVNYLGAEYLIRTYIEDLTGSFLTLTVWTNGVLPLLAFIITFFIKSTQKKKPLSPQETGGFR